MILQDHGDCGSCCTFLFKRRKVISCLHLQVLAVEYKTFLVASPVLERTTATR
jgi:hypothetical protein